MNRSIFAVSLAAFLAISFQPCGGTEEPVSEKPLQAAPDATASAPAAPAQAESDEDVPEIVGQPAQPFMLPLFGFGQMDLASHKGKDIVVLDFWATWCGPCVMALPALAEVTDAYREKGVVFYAVDQREDPDAIGKFLRAKKLDVTVAMDLKGEVGQAYGVQGIPETVIIDKNGVVQSVHIGYNPNLKERLTGELEALLAGKSLAAPRTLSKPNLKGLDAAWNFAGHFSGLASGGGKLYALGAKGQCEILDDGGQSTGQVTLETTGTMARSAKLAAGDARQLLVFQSWGTELKAFDAAGARLWTYSGGDGINDVWVADLNGDGLDEVIVGYNGSTGVHVLNHDGHLLWKNAKLGNVWHVSAGDLRGTGAGAVLSTSGIGDVYVFDAEGHAQPEIQPGALYANMVRIVPSVKGSPGKILAAGSDEDREELAAYDPDGKNLWTLTVSDGKGHVDSAAVAPAQPWLAVSLRGGKVLVIDTDKGEIIGQATGEAPRGEVTWMATAEGPLLIVTGKDAIHSYRVKAK